ncbi:hypothetical protein DS739_00915 [Acetobacter sp. JWB]|nr:hypothetical protein CPF11_06520 [Acetobacter pomorum]AXC25489.1 hypothetical protein DS739_00915 [Acetobacter sp. JWB]
MVFEFCEVFRTILDNAQQGFKVSEDNRKLYDLTSDTFSVYGFTGVTPAFQNLDFFLRGAFIQNVTGNHGIVAGKSAKGFLDGSFLFRAVCPTSDFPFGSGFIF